MGRAEYTRARLQLQMPLNRIGLFRYESGMSEPTKPFSIWPWVLRFVLMALALSAPIVTYRAFTDPETPDPERDIREAEERNRLNRERGRVVPRQEIPYEARP